MSQYQIDELRSTADQYEQQLLDVHAQVSRDRISGMMGEVRHFLDYVEDEPELTLSDLRASASGYGQAPDVSARRMVAVWQFIEYLERGQLPAMFAFTHERAAE